ncbi:MAG TPA: hypothetical protein VF039_14655 [Longimicrobiales bacterium]
MTIRRTHVPVSVRSAGVLLLVSFVCYGAHELVHHLVARATCGAWGTMTFSTFELATGCEPAGPVLLATLAGPVLTYLMMYAGAALILRGRTLAGVTLVLANLPLARLVTVLMRGGDEMVLGRAWIGGDAAWPVLLALTIALLAGPVALAWRAIANRRRAALFAALLVLPLFVDVLVKRVLLARLLDSWPAAVGGVPLLFVVAMAVASAALYAIASRPPRMRGTGELAAESPV